MVGKTGSVVLAWFIKGMLGSRVMGRRGSGSKMWTAGAKKVRFVGRGVGGRWLTRVRWESEVWAGAVLFRLGNLRCRREGLLEDEARLASSLAKWVM